MCHEGVFKFGSISMESLVQSTMRWYTYVTPRALYERSRSAGGLNGPCLLKGIGKYSAFDRLAASAGKCIQTVGRTCSAALVCASPVYAGLIGGLYALTNAFYLTCLCKGGHFCGRLANETLRRFTLLP